MERWLYLSNERFTVAVLTVDGVVVGGPPLTRKFMGRHVKHLVRWMRKTPGFRMERMK